MYNVPMCQRRLSSGGAMCMFRGPVTLNLLFEQLRQRHRHTSNCPAVVQFEMYSVPMCQRQLSSGGASSLLAAGCLMHTHAQEQKKCKVCCCKSSKLKKHMTIYKQWNASKCKRTCCLMCTQRSRSNAKCVAKVNIVQKI